MALVLTECNNVSHESGDEKMSSRQNTVTPINCTDLFCEGSYSGAEFIAGSDIAHQFSNKMSAVVGEKLKAFYKEGKYSQVDFSKIEMTTKGMGTGRVVYKLHVPFVRAESSCAAFTSFDHVGGWNHAPELQKRKAQLQSALMTGDRLYLSELMRTKEGLQEYWIQWRNKSVQVECQGK